MNWIQIPFHNDKYVITIAGDTYFGEKYTEIRKKKGVQDALQLYGYGYSFEKVSSMFTKNEFNLLNFEAALTENETIWLSSEYTIALKGKADNTADELKSRNIHAVMLANNHIMDYGESGCSDTLQAFQSRGFFTLGAGYNVKEAEKPLFLQCDKKVLIFNAYWYNEGRHKVSRLYAIGENTGIACLSDMYFDSIRQYRRRFPDAFMILCAHWGRGFVTEVTGIRILAKRAVAAGIDCIVAHGPHIILPYEWIDGKLVLYSIGNFIFNGNVPEFSRLGIPPYAYVAKVIFYKDTREVRLYPIMVDGPKCFWQPYPVGKEQLDELMGYYKVDPGVVAQDHLGYYLSLGINGPGAFS